MTVTGAALTHRVPTLGDLLQQPAKRTRVHIYIDESGPFGIPRANRPAINMVGALILPDTKHDAVLNEFELLAAEWPRANGEEIKGRLLSENHFYDLVELLGRHNVLFDAIALDTGLETETKISAHQEDQAQRLERVVTPAHLPSLAQDVRETAAAMRALSLPQYLQFVAMTQLIGSVMRTKIMYFAQIAPAELSAFRWRIDAKADTLTQAEMLWRKMLGLFLQSRSVREPDILLAEGDYSHFERFTAPIPPGEIREREAALGLPPNPHVDTQHGTNIKLVLEDMTFRDSKTDLGLQLVDVVTSLAARAMRGTIGRRAWWNLGRIMLRPLPPAEVIYLMNLTMPYPAWNSDPPYYNVLIHLRKTALSLLVDENRSAD